MARFSYPAGGGGSASVDTGDITFDGTIISTVDNGQNITIDTLDDNGDIGARLRLIPDDGVARLEARHTYSNNYFSDTWTSAFLVEDESNRYIEITDPAEFFLDFLNSSAWNNAVERYIGYDFGERGFIYGQGTTENTITFFLEPTGTPSDPVAINNLDLYYENRSRIEIDMNDDEEIAIRGNGIDVDIYSTDDVRIGANDLIELDASEDLSLRSGNTARLESENDIVIGSYSGGEYLNSNESGNNQIATIGDVGVETPYAVQGGTSGTQPTFTGDPLFSASYIRMSSNLVHFQIDVDMDNITSFGTGQYYMTLPFPSKYGYKFRDGCLHDIDAGRLYHISGHVYPESNVLELFTTDVSGNRVYDFAFAQGEPITLSTADNFHIAGTYICE